MENYSQELNETLNEAMNVRIELESIMESAIQISQTIVDKFEEKINQIPESSALLYESETPLTIESELQEEMIVSVPQPAEETERIINQVQPSHPRRIRIHELAKDVQMPSKVLIKLINNLGIHVSSHMSALDERQMRLVKQAIDTGVSLDELQPMIEPSPEKTRGIHTKTKGRTHDFVIENDQEKYEELISAAARENTNRSAQEPLQGLEFSIEELKKAHPYIAVKTMYDNGYQIRDIAKLLGRGQGEVSLILNLSNKKASIM